jgi:TRAP-type C4-dicarboxylate transport system permease small subunit
MKRFDLLLQVVSVAIMAAMAGLLAIGLFGR